jgi:hypothetical protein
MKQFIEESSTRLKTKFCKLYKPRALQNAIVGQANNDKDLETKGKKSLALIKKIKDKLDFPRVS